MRPMYVPVRLAATVMAVAAAAGCMSVGDDEGGRAKPSHSASHRGGEAPDGGPAGVGGGYMGAAGGDGKRGHGKGKARASASASASSSPSAGASASVSAPHVKPGRTEKPGMPTPPRAQPSTPPRSPDPEPPAPTPEPPVPSPEPTVAEPSSSAHEEGGSGGTAAQLTQREPAPEAGTPA
ncbi:hypothetical protein ACIBVL_14240 [Streptomyces sp. NPDC049687]|uniref:hypothetical protein n=1 Tax=Streptomyces sp. NPDC049687 TaxID=3365596 RepID=UPI00378A8ECB